MNQRKSLEEMNLTDNFLFGAAMDNEESGKLIAEAILTTLLHRDIKIKKINPEKTFWPPSEKFHGVRLDAYIEEESVEVLPGNIYDLEPDNISSQKKWLPRRSRYYHSSIDSRLLRSGKSYDVLPPVWVIFITTYDPFEEDRMVYTIRKHCIELPEMECDDGTATIFLNVNGTKGNPPEDLKMLLRYLSDTRAENACNPKLTQIQKCIEKIKQDPDVWRQYMNWQEYIELERKDAVEEQRKENDELKKRADEAEAEVLRLKALLKSNGIKVENE